VAMSKHLEMLLVRVGVKEVNDEREKWAQQADEDVLMKKTGVQRGKGEGAK